MTDHSPEPWKPFFCGFWHKSLDEGSCCGYEDDLGNIIHLSDSHMECGHVVDLEDAKRFCACVNACVGIPISTLEEGVVVVQKRRETDHE